MMKTAYLLFGSNLGDRKANLAMASSFVENSVGTIIQSSHIYESVAWGKENQPDFLNQVVKIQTILSPNALLEKLAWTEVSLGRIRDVRWGERIIDIDILFYENEIIKNLDLTIPHEGIPFRKFTLLPLAELAPQLIHPGLNKTITQLLAECEDPLEIWHYVTDS